MGFFMEKIAFYFLNKLNKSTYISDSNKIKENKPKSYRHLITPSYSTLPFLSLHSHITLNYEWTIFFIIC